MVRPSRVLGQLSQWGVAVMVAVVASSAPAKATPVGSVPAATVASCHSTETRLPTQSELETLQALVQKYKVAVPDVAIDKTALTRCQFASRLNALIDQVNEVIAAGEGELLPKADLSTFQKLVEAYAAELADYRSGTTLEARTATLEKQQFSTRTRLCSEGCGASVDLIGETLRALRAWLDDPTSQAMTMQFSTLTTLSRESLLQLQPPPLSFQRDALSTRTKEQEQQQALEADFLATLRLPSVITNGVPGQSVPPVPPNLYAPANPTDVQAFLPLAKRYGCFTQVPRSHSTYNPARYEFADALYNCADKMHALASPGPGVIQADQRQMIRLQALYSSELAALRQLTKFQFKQLLNNRLKALELKAPASRTFAPTTTLQVETVLEVSGTAGNR